MNHKRIFAFAVVCIFMTTAKTFAFPGIAKLNPGKPIPEVDNQNEISQICPLEQKNYIKDPNISDKPKDPIEALQKRKERIQSLLKEGKITKQKAEEITKKIDAKIKKLQEFNRLSPQQKKSKLIEHYRKSLDESVKSGKVSRERADQLMKKFIEKMQKWDGKGYPNFKKKKHK